MSHVSWTPRGAPPSSGEGYPSSGKSPRNCAALSDRWTGGGSWLLPAAAAAEETLSSDPTRHPSPTHDLARGLLGRILGGSLHSIPLQSRVSLVGWNCFTRAAQSTSVHPAGRASSALNRAPPPPPLLSPCRPRRGCAAAGWCASDAALGEPGYAWCWLATICTALPCVVGLYWRGGLEDLLPGQCAPVHGLGSACSAPEQCAPRQTSASARSDAQERSSNSAGATKSIFCIRLTSSLPCERRKS